MSEPAKKIVYFGLDSAFSLVGWLMIWSVVDHSVFSYPGAIVLVGVMLVRLGAFFGMRA